MARTTIKQQYENYKKQYEKSVKSLAKHNLKPRNELASFVEFQLEVLTRRSYNQKDITRTIVKEQTLPMTSRQEQALLNGLFVIVNGKKQFSAKAEQLLNQFGLLDKYKKLLELKQQKNIDLLAAELVKEIYEELQKYFENTEGQTEAIAELIGEAFYGS